MNPRSEKLRQRAVALNLIQDDGPLTPEDFEREIDDCRASGITLEDLHDTLEELLDAAAED